MRLGHPLRLALAACASACDPGALHDAAVEGSAGPQSYIVLASGERSRDGLATDVARLGANIVCAEPEAGLLVASSSDPGFADSAARLSGVLSVTADAAITRVDARDEELAPIELPPPTARRAAGEITDPLYPVQWNLEAIDWRAAYDAGVRGAGVRVVVLDNGIDADHPDLATQVNAELSVSFIAGESWNPPEVPGHHGTAVAGVIGAAVNGEGMVGVAPEAELVAVKIWGDAFAEGTVANIICGLLYAGTIDADVVNMSVGDFFHIRDGGDGFAFHIASKRAAAFVHARGATLVGAAGNDALDWDTAGDLRLVPQSAEHVLMISATGPRGWALDPSVDVDEISFYSNFGHVIDFAAPGGNRDADLFESGIFCDSVAGVEWAPPIRCFRFDGILATNTFGGWGFGLGTSLAAPHVSGVAALIIGQHGGEMKPSRVHTALRASADDLGESGKDERYGRGRINAGAVVSLP